MSDAGHVDWTNVLLAAITTIGSVFSAYFASRAGRHRRKAAESAQIAVKASLRPKE